MAHALGKYMPLRDVPPHFQCLRAYLAMPHLDEQACGSLRTTMRRSCPKVSGLVSLGRPGALVAEGTKEEVQDAMIKASMGIRCKDMKDGNLHEAEDLGVDVQDVDAWRAFDGVEKTEDLKSFLGGIGHMDWYQTLSEEFSKLEIFQRPRRRAYASGQSSQLRRLLERGWRPKRTLTEALLGILEPSSAPFRFRELGDGRPGLLLQNVLFSLGDGPAQVLVEWPVGRSFYHSWCWQIPPSPTSSTQSGGPHLEDSADDEPWVEGPFPWGLRYGWVVELQSTEEQQGPGASRFLHVGAGKPAGKITLDDLCQEPLP
ncbi:unnamed protein product [Prorocentrum cordatum]|uniref:Uncharacterized protein n=1 Tax=Prorocentrum cordatum TaxID=2364126 RepID=A0ABN9SYH4_9DINO|nr:unnamed protein product [Polarella glacialis]